MAVTSGAMMAILTVPASLCQPHCASLTVPASLGQHLKGQVARRVDAQHLEGNRPPSAPPDLFGRPGIEDPGQLHRLAIATELHGHRSGEADVRVATGGEPVQVVRPDYGHAPARPTDPLHLG